jgi:biotin carboxyl carrier protein
MTFEIEIGGRRYPVSIRPLGAVDRSGGLLQVTVHDAAGSGGETAHRVDARRTDLGVSLLFVDSGRVADAAVTERARGALLVQFPSVDVSAAVGDRGQLAVPAADSRGTGQQRVTAPMPGRILRILVQQDAEIVAGQGLVVIEAMKMENELKAQRGGFVRELLMAEGDSVEAGRLLIVIE